MRVLWLVGPIFKQSTSGEDPEHAIFTSPLASARLRMGVAAREWRRAGHENLIVDPRQAAPDGHSHFEAAPICVVQKFFAGLELDPWVEACSAAKRNGSKLVVDICDFPFHENKDLCVHTFYAAVLKMCDAVVVNSEKMAEFVAPYTSHRPLVIEDAILGPPGKPMFSPDSRLELVWFGHSSNLRYFRGCLDSLVLFAMQRRCRMTVITNAGRGAEELASEIQARFAPALEARFIPWSLEATRIALRRCDLVLIPSDPSDPKKAGASANRIAETLNAGRFPVASPLPSYLPFGDSAWLGHDMVEGIRWALANRGEALARIRRGQALVAEKFAAEKIGRQWREFFESLV